jgi:hypothetical protein
VENQKTWVLKRGLLPKVCLAPKRNPKHERNKRSVHCILGNKVVVHYEPTTQNENCPPRKHYAKSHARAFTRASFHKPEPLLDLARALHTSQVRSEAPVPDANTWVGHFTSLVKCKLYGIHASDVRLIELA